LKKNIDNSFSILPFHNHGLNKNFASRLPSVCIGFSTKLKRIINKADCNMVFKSGAKLQNLLCSKHKTSASKIEKKGVYQLSCPCSPKAIYIGQTSRSIETCMGEHKGAAEKQKWTHSRITQHKEACHLPGDLENPNIITTMQDKNKSKLVYDLKVRKALERKKSQCSVVMEKASMRILVPM
jgi:hypothetical protein